MQINGELEDLLTRIVSDVVRDDCLICKEAEKLLDEIQRRETTYEVRIAGCKYFITTDKGCYPADIQRAVELREGLTLDELNWPYLRPQDIKQY